MKRIFITVMLALTLAGGLACTKKVNPNPSVKVDKAADVIRGAKVFGRNLSIALTQGIALENELASNGTIDAELHPKLSQWLQDGKKAVDDFNERATHYTTLDETSRADIAKLLSDSIAAIRKLNDEGVLRIKNPHSQLVASGIITAASVAVSIYQSTFENAQQ
jgi:hypothetical protein